MVDIRPAQSSDREAILRFLRPQGRSGRPYERLFDYPWRDADWNFGYVLAERGVIKGYLGHIYSRRIVGSRRYRFANQTSWSVDPDYRRYSLALFRASLDEPDVVITNFSANEPARRILEAYQFRKLDSSKCIISPHHGYFGKIDPDSEITPDRLDEFDGEERRIIETHLPLGCIVYAPATEAGRVLIVVLRRRFRSIPYADVLHSTAPLSVLLALGIPLMIRHRVVALGLPKRFIDDRCLLTLGNGRPTYYRSDTLRPVDIDSLYSEFPLLYGAP